MSKFEGCLWITFIVFTAATLVIAIIGVTFC